MLIGMVKVLMFILILIILIFKEILNILLRFGVRFFGQVKKIKKIGF